MAYNKNYNRNQPPKFYYSKKVTNPYKQPEVNDPPNDTISGMAWVKNPTKMFLCASSWDNCVYAYDIKIKANSDAGVVTSKITTAKHKAPVLCVYASKNGRIFSGGCDNTVKVTAFPGVNLGRGSTTTFDFGKHNDCVKTIHHCPEKNIVISGGWDKKVRYFDDRFRANQHVHELTLPERVYCADLRNNYYMVCCGGKEKQIGFVDLRAPKKIWKTQKSRLKLQTRCCRLLPDASGYCLGSIGGRVTVDYFDTNKKWFSFKCHRIKNLCFAVNDLSFHPKKGYLTTVGGDGKFSVWDLKNQKGLYNLNKAFSLPLVQGEWDPEGNVFAIGVGYDFSMGTEVDVFKKNAHNAIVLQKNTRQLMGQTKPNYQ